MVSHQRFRNVYQTVAQIVLLNIVDLPTGASFVHVGRPTLAQAIATLALFERAFFWGGRGGRTDTLDTIKLKMPRHAHRISSTLKHTLFADRGEAAPSNQRQGKRVQTSVWHVLFRTYRAKRAGSLQP